MDWRTRWALLDAVALDNRLVCYRFQYLDGTQRTIVVDGKRRTVADAAALLDRIEAQRVIVDRSLLDRVD